MRAIRETDIVAVIFATHSEHNLKVMSMPTPERPFWELMREASGERFIVNRFDYMIRKPHYG